MKLRFPLPITILAILAATALSAPPAGSMSREVLAAHNQIRARYHLPSLVWSDRLAATAQSWAGHLIATGGFEHRQNPQYGENLFEITGATASPSQVVDSWASEAAEYDYASNTCRGVCGHFTQLVWRNTKEVGCASASRGSRQVWVCNYSPPGNYIGERPW